eukprot:26730-Eustigmatos_ZCMA.PRE.1
MLVIRLESIFRMWLKGKEGVGVVCGRLSVNVATDEEVTLKERCATRPTSRHVQLNVRGVGR